MELVGRWPPLPSRRSLPRRIHRFYRLQRLIRTCTLCYKDVFVVQVYRHRQPRRSWSGYGRIFHAVDTERNVHSLRSALKPRGKSLSSAASHPLSTALFIFGFLGSHSFMRGPRRENTLQSPTCAGRADPKEWCASSSRHAASSPLFGQFGVLPRTRALMV